jgi:hypothetical protein
MRSMSRASFIEPCLPSPADEPPSGSLSEWGQQAKQTLGSSVIFAGAAKAASKLPDSAKEKFEEILDQIREKLPDLIDKGIDEVSRADAQGEAREHLARG